MLSHSQSSRWRTLVFLDYFPTITDSTIYVNPACKLFNFLQLYVSAWRVVLKVGTGADISPATSIENLWLSDVTVNDDRATYLNTHDTYVARFRPTYKSDIINSWEGINHVRMQSHGISGVGGLLCDFVFNIKKQEWYSLFRKLDTTPGKTSYWIQQLKK